MALNDKSKKNKGAPSSVKALDPAEYTRQAIALPELSHDEPTPANGIIKNIEQLFPEWDISNEAWGEPYDLKEEMTAGMYPTELGVVSEKTIRSLYGLDAIVPTGKNVKHQKNTATVNVHADVDENNRPIPKIFVDDENSSYDGYRWTRQFIMNSEGSDRIDPAMCAIYDIVQQYGPSVVSSKPGQAPLLWQSIYPKAQNKGYFNPSGKYCIQLHVAGKWRKIYVNDSIPLRSDGSWALARSSQGLELWPTLLSKAIYYVYHTTCYSQFNVGMDPGKRHAAFVGFAIHMLTGWLPSLPIYLPSAMEQDKPRVQGLIQEMLFGGAAAIDKENIPGPVPTEDYNSDESTRQTKKTLKVFKDEYDNRKAKYLAALAARDERESKITAIDSVVTSTYHECYVVTFPSEDTSGLYISLPILGVSLPSTSVTPIDLDKVSFLVNWKISRPSIINTDISTVQDEPNHPSRIEFPSLPSMTDLSMTWMGGEELARKGAFILPVETLTRVSTIAQLGWHWNPYQTTAKVEPKAGRTEKRGSTSSVISNYPTNTQNPDMEGKYLSPGSLPPTILSLDTSSFFTSSSNESDTSDHPLSTHLSLTIKIQADVHAESNTLGENYWTIPESIVVVLQEIVENAEDEPLVMRLELPKKAAIPLTRATFHIPVDRLPFKANGRGPFLFWVRLFGQASVYLSFRSAVNMQIGDAADIWRIQINDGINRHSLVKEGTMSAVHKGTEKILFNLPLTVVVSEDTSEDGDGAEKVSVIVYLHISDPSIANKVSLVILSPLGEDSFILPRLEGDRFYLPLKYQSSSTLLARISSESDIPSFKWKLSLLSTMQLNIEALPSKVEIGAQDTKIYEGVYIPNNKLRLFSDCYSIDKLSFPFSFKITLNSNDINQSVEVNENVRLVTRIYRKYDRQLVVEYRSKSVLQVYNLPSSLFVSPTSISSVPAAPPATQVARQPTRAKVDAVQPQELVELLIDCSIDESTMNVHPSWRSSYPYVFQSSINPASNSNLEPMFKWRVNIISGQIGSVVHDLYNQERYLEVKNSWDVGNNGRAEQAKAALESYKLRNALISQSCEGSLLSTQPKGIIDKQVDLLAITLRKDKESARKRIELLSAAPKYQEHYASVPSNYIPENHDSNLQEEEGYVSLLNQLHAKFDEQFTLATKHRLENLTNILTAYNAESTSKWLAREDYKATVDAQNSALADLLEKGREAIRLEEEKENDALGKSKPKKK